MSRRKRVSDLGRTGDARAAEFDAVLTADEESAKTWVARFQLFHSARIAFGLLATALAGYELLL